MKRLGRNVSQVHNIKKNWRFRVKFVSVELKVTVKKN